MYKNGEIDEFNQITDIENSAKYAQRDEFLMRCEFQLEGEFFEARVLKQPKPTNRIQINVFEFQRRLFADRSSLLQLI